MVFSSPAFIFFFLPAVLVLDRILRNNLKARNWLLVAVSLLFLAFGQLQCVPLFLASALINYLTGLYFIRREKGKKPVLILNILLNLLILAVFKYTVFLLENINAVFSFGIPLPRIILPLGISFFTFQGLSYVIDTWRKPENGTENFMDFLLFMGFFPQFIQGPILRFPDFSPQLVQRTENLEQTAEGLRRFVVGLSKKLLIAAEMGKIADSVFARTASCALDWRLAWLAGIAYSLQIYYDFSGYSDMAVGLAKAFGFTISENFSFPYGAVSIRDFWRRWHITLSSWFRDYVYIPLGGSRRGKGRTYFNRMMVFLCTGIWHGANWTYVIWGVLHGVLSNLENAGLIPVDRLQKTRAGRAVSRIYTLLAVILLFVVFRADDLRQAWSVIRSMFSFTATPDGWFTVQSLLPAARCVVMGAGILLSGNWAAALARKTSALENGNTLVRIAVYAGSILLFALSLLAMSGGGFSPFIYTQF